MDREEAFAICFANLKGSKDKDLVGLAGALRYLKGLPEYRTNDKVGKAVGVSGEMVREFLTFLKLPKPIQKLFKERQLKYVEQCRRLWQFERNRPGLLEEVAQAIRDMTVLEGRQVINFLLLYPDTSVMDAKMAVIKSRTVRQREYHVIAILSEDEYKSLFKEARRRKESVDVLVTGIVHDWLESRGVNV